MTRSITTCKHQRLSVSFPHSYWSLAPTCCQTFTVHTNNELNPYWHSGLNFLDQLILNHVFAGILTLTLYYVFSQQDFGLIARAPCQCWAFTARATGGDRKAISQCQPFNNTTVALPISLFRYMTGDHHAPTQFSHSRGMSLPCSPEPDHDMQTVRAD